MFAAAPVVAAPVVVAVVAAPVVVAVVAAPVVVAMNSSSNATNVTGVPLECNPLPSWGPPVGIFMGVIGSVGINVGQNLQATGMQSLPEELRMKPHNSKVWIIGLTIFISFSLINFAALALAPASVLTPIESIQFVNNIVWNRAVNKKAISRRRMWEW